MTENGPRESSDDARVREKSNSPQEAGGRQVRKRRVISGNDKRRAV